MNTNDRVKTALISKKMFTFICFQIYEKLFMPEAIAQVLAYPT